MVILIGPISFILDKDKGNMAMTGLQSGQQAVAGYAGFWRSVASPFLYTLPVVLTQPATPGQNSK